MIRLLLVGDPHLKKYKQHEYLPMIEQIVGHAERLKPDGVALMGDLLDAHDTIDLTAQCDAQRLVFELSQRLQLRTIVLVGNHDRINNSEYLTKYSSLYGLSYTPQIELIDQPKIIDLKGIKIGAVPYIPTGRYEEAIRGTGEEEQWRAVRLNLTHQDWRGSVYNGQVSTEGDESLTPEIPTYNGHIHDYGRPRTHILNIGAPRQIAFGENEDKALVLLIISPNPSIAIIEERIPLDLPKRRILKLSVEEARKWLPKDNDNSLYKLEVVGGSAAIEGFIRSDHWKMLKAKGVKLKRTYQREVIPIRIVNDRRNYLDRLQEFIGYDKEQLAAYHRLILNYRDQLSGKNEPIDS